MIIFICVYFVKLSVQASSVLPPPLDYKVLNASRLINRPQTLTSPPVISSL